MIEISNSSPTHFEWSWCTSVPGSWIACAPMVVTSGRSALSLAVRLDFRHFVGTTTDVRIEAIGSVKTFWYTDQGILRRHIRARGAMLREHKERDRGAERAASSLAPARGPIGVT